MEQQIEQLTDEQYYWVWRRKKGITVDGYNLNRKRIIEFSNWLYQKKVNAISDEVIVKAMIKECWFVEDENQYIFDESDFDKIIQSIRKLLNL